MADNQIRHNFHPKKSLISIKNETDKRLIQYETLLLRMIIITWYETLLLSDKRTLRPDREPKINVKSVS
jgi:hypothetical protein